MDGHEQRTVRKEDALLNVHEGHAGRRHGDGRTAQAGLPVRFALLSYHPHRAAADQIISATSLHRRATYEGKK
jgi:hypothetical protein